MTFFGDQPFLCGEGGEAGREGREAESSCRNGFVEEQGIFSDSSFLCVEPLPGPEHTGAEVPCTFPQNLLSLYLMGFFLFVCFCFSKMRKEPEI